MTYNIQMLLEEDLFIKHRKHHFMMIAKELRLC